MNEAEYHRVAAIRPDLSVSAADLTGEDRTLLYGYDVHRVTWHVYLRYDTIHLAHYRSDEAIIFHLSQFRWEDASDLVPNKRLYPARCDYAFASLLRRKGIDLCFTRFQEVPLPDTGFYGVIA